MERKTLNVNEIFHSIQGEGKTIGKNVVFLRLAKCNLRCKFCDSKYSWESGTNMLISEIIDFIVDKNPQGLCITGGEPLLQQENILILLDKLNETISFSSHLSHDFSVEIETNGTIEPQSSLMRNSMVNFNISPKLENSQNDEQIERYDTGVLGKIAIWRKKTIFKFVITEIHDLVEIKKIIDKAKIRKEQIYLMPEGITTEEQMKKQWQVITWALENGWNFSPRIQVLVWDKKRGV